MQARGCLTSYPFFFKHSHQPGMGELGNLREIFPLVCVFKGIIKDLLSAFLFPLFSSLIFPASFPLPFPSIVSISLWLLFLCGHYGALLSHPSSSLSLFPLAFNPSFWPSVFLVPTHPGQESGNIPAHPRGGASPGPGVLVMVQGKFAAGTL